ncbi:hypothetical protein OROHE_005495 [Orobanche hederae]
MGETLTNTSGFSAIPHEVGAGEIRPIKALDPGLAFETTISDHLYFLCCYGYKQKDIGSMTSNTKFMYPKKPNEQLISSINYPSISIGRLNQYEGPRKVKRLATNMGSSLNATYVSSVNAPPCLKVNVVPKTIVFTEGLRTASFKVYFDGKQASKGYNYGAIRLSDGTHVVRVVFAVNVE